MKTIGTNTGYKESLTKVGNDLQHCIEFMTGSVLSLIGNQSKVSYAWSRCKL